MFLPLESVDEILQCDHSNETSSTVLSHGTIACVAVISVSFKPSGIHARAWSEKETTAMQANGTTDI